ncbi:MAG: tetratricopeptide repeat protein, partial [Chloroflexi bacterium]|nr:tetratricopeptide repeat protein [Chloroflexota bacterium]
SLWGSYQRLQGTYTTFAYLVIFGLLLVHLRRREQLERLLMAIVLASLPVSLYGLLQHYRLDPLPWGGDTTFRVASTMGNPIFVAAYLIMVVPLTIARLAQQIARAVQGAGARERTLVGAMVGLALTAQVFAWALLGLTWGVLVALVTSAALAVTAALMRRPPAGFLSITAYVLILGAQVVCVFFTQSRGPWLGLAAGLFIFALLYVAARGWRRVGLALAIVALLGAGGIGWLNMPGAPQEALREVPYVGRLGQLLETDSGTGKVRILIWEAVVEMLAADPARAAVGYGPEAMYVAFSPFYPPDLAHYEARNRSPDRAHNETFDALVTTGFVGLLAYMVLFASLFYHGLRWLGLLDTPGRRRAFLLCGALGAAAGVALPVALDGSARYAGVGLPLGFVGGLGLYLMGAALAEFLGRGAPRGAERALSHHALLVAALLAGVVAHFVEIHFGIAIAATRTYFWAYAALLVVLGEGLLTREVPAARPVAVTSQPRRGRTRAERRREAREPRAAGGGWLTDLRTHPMAAPALLTGCTLVVMVWGFTTNPQMADNAVAVLLDAWTTLAGVGRPLETSLGLVWALLATLLAGGALALGIGGGGQGRRPVALALFAALAGGLALTYAVWHAGTLTRATDPAVLVYGFYAFLAVVWLALTGLLLARAPSARDLSPDVATWRRWAAPLAAAPLVLAALFLVNAQNIGMVRADVVHKQGYQYDLMQRWEQAAAYYRRAHELAPAEDHYLLFLGRALLELASAQGEPARAEAYYGQALDVLVEARRLSPLNTDHTANIARLYRRWALADPDPAGAEAKRLLALEAYDQAVRLSPNSAQLRNERGMTYLDLGDLEQASTQYAESLALDDRFIQTYLLLGEMYYGQGDWSRAAWAYERATGVDARSLQAWAALGNAYANLGEWGQAVNAFQRALEVDYRTPRIWAYMGDAYSRLGDAESAIDAYQRAVALDDAFAEAWRALGEHLARLDRWDEAQAAFERLLELAP